MPIRASLTIVALAAAIWILDKGKDFFVPVVAAALLAFTLMPLVRLGQRFNIPAAVVATVILFGAGLGGGALVSSNAKDAAKLVARMPELTQFIVVKVRRLLLVSRDGHPRRNPPPAADSGIHVAKPLHSACMKRRRNRVGPQHRKGKRHDKDPPAPLLGIARSA